jgi:two-component sensor histidine kinase
MIMSELVQNAIEHGLGAAGGEVRIGIERLADDRGQPMVVVSIEDDGKGIDPARRPGSGLGTQIVQSLVGDLQGRITWEPVVPHGTRARFTARLRPIT